MLQVKTFTKRQQAFIAKVKECFKKDSRSDYTIAIYSPTFEKIRHLRMVLLKYSDNDRTPEQFAIDHLDCHPSKVASIIDACLEE